MVSPAAMNYFSDFLLYGAGRLVVVLLFLRFFIEGDIMLLTKWDNSGIIKP